MLDRCRRVAQDCCKCLNIVLVHHLAWQYPRLLLKQVHRQQAVQRDRCHRRLKRQVAERGESRCMSFAVRSTCAVRTRASACTHMHPRVCVNAHSDTYMCAHVCARAYVCAPLSACLCTVCACVHAHVCMTRCTCVYGCVRVCAGTCPLA